MKTKIFILLLIKMRKETERKPKKSQMSDSLRWKTFLKC